MPNPTQKEVRTTKLKLSKISIFEALSADTLPEIESQCSWRWYEPREIIVGYLEERDDVFFLVEGHANVTIYSESGKVVNFRELEPGSVFGEYPAIAGGARSAGVEAKTECLVAAMSGEAFNRLLTTQPSVSRALLEKAIGTIRRLTERVYEFSTLAVNNRIQAELLRLALTSLADHDQGERRRIYPAPTHAEIASRISTHREAVTRELNRLTHNGLLERVEGALVIRDLNRLQRMVHEATGE
jgi:CRP-like cAMP-binding protein